MCCDFIEDWIADKENAEKAKEILEKIYEELRKMENIGAIDGVQELYDKYMELSKRINELMSKIDDWERPEEPEGNKD